MMIGIVVLLADQQQRRRGQSIQQLRRRQQPASAQLDDMPQLGMLARLRALPGRQGSGRLQRLAGNQAQQTKQ